jgi:hypothetical protein
MAKNIEKSNGIGKRGFLSEQSAANTNPFDWQTVDCRRLSDLIGLITGRGGAVRFGYSRDGFAGSIGVYYGDDRDTVYIRPNQDPEEVFGLIERTFENLPMTSGRAPANGAVK